KNFDRFEEYLNWIVSGGDDDKGERGMAVISTHLNSTDVYQHERSLHLTLTQEIMNEDQNSPYWTGGLKGGRVATGFLPLPAIANTGVRDLEGRNETYEYVDENGETQIGNRPIKFNANGILLFYSESGLIEQDTTLIAGTWQTFIPCKLPQWQKEDSMTPDIMNPKFTYRGVREGDLLDQSTINGFFNRVTNTIQGIFTKAATHAQILTSLLVLAKKFSVRIRAMEFAITALQDFNPVGCIVQFIGFMTWERTQYYKLCDGGLCGGNSTQNDGEFADINKFLFAMWKDRKEKGLPVIGDIGDEIDLGKEYNLPDLSGLFLVGASMGVNKIHDSAVEEIPLNKTGGKSSHVQTIDELAKHVHKHVIRTADSNGSHNINGFGNGEWSSGKSDWKWGNSRGGDSWNNEYALRTYQDSKEVGGSTPPKGIPTIPPYFAVNYYMRVRV
ncbi:MAG: hypothetical protein LBH98_01250, partial [Chitinispirillales bacterium]|nr:hypothetical protein [Chitinispirillales bacterium]